MTETLIKATSFVTTIMVGYVLRHGGLFKEEDPYVSSKIALKIMLPAAIISNFLGVNMKPSMLLLSPLGLGDGMIFVTTAFLINIGKSEEERASHIINMSGHSTGNFILPFAQGFLGPSEVMATSLFDSDNAPVCLGSSYSIASVAKGGKNGFSTRSVIKSLLISAPFDVYLLTTILLLPHSSLSSPVASSTGIIANVNTFVIMLILDVGFKMTGDGSQLGRIVEILGIRYSISIALALTFRFLLPLMLEYRQALTILALSPIASSSSIYTAELRGDIGLSSAVSSLSIIVSMVLATGTLLMILQLFFIVCKKFYGECIF